MRKVGDVASPGAVSGHGGPVSRIAVNLSRIAPCRNRPGSWTRRCRSSNRLEPVGAKPIDSAERQEKRTRPEIRGILRSAPLSYRHWNCMRERALSCKEAGRTGELKRLHPFVCGIPWTANARTRSRERNANRSGPMRRLCPARVRESLELGNCRRPPAAQLMPPMHRTPSVEARKRIEFRRFPLEEQLRCRRSNPGATVGEFPCRHRGVG